MKHFFQGTLFLFALSFLSSCGDDDGGTSLDGKGQVQFEITDGPVDDEQVKGVFVTVASVKVDGEVISDFSGTQTIDLMAYQNGNTKALGLAELETRTYSDVSLVLDYSADADGNSPGCYVLTADGVKHDLQASTTNSSEINLTNTPFEVSENNITNLLLDFDLRKACRYAETPQGSDGYDFVTDAELRSSLRLVEKSKTGEIKGKVSDDLGLAGGRIVVYAYAKGEFDKDQEVEGKGTSQVKFANAVTSANVDAAGNYTLAFLSAGEYELHYFSYEDADNDGRAELMGELELSLMNSLGLDLQNVNVEANSSVDIDVSVTGLLP